MKTFSEFLIESKNKPVLVVDLQQPFLKHFPNYPIEKVMGFLNQQKSITHIYVSNEEGFLDTEQSEQDVLYFWEENGFDTTKNVQMIDKRGWGFFRDWIDKGISNRTIIQTIRLMFSKKITDFRDFEGMDIEKLFGMKEDDFLELFENESFYLPELSMSALKQLNGCYLIGGGKTECLLEIKLLLDAFNIKYKQITNFIYG